MPGLLNHSPADVLRRALIEATVGSEPPTPPTPVTAAWPVYATTEPNAPDNVITCYDTADITGDRDGHGEREEYNGVQVRVRAATFQVGYPKASAVAMALDALYRMTVTMPGGVQYLVESVTRTSGVLDLGFDSSTKRRVFTINGLVTVRKIIP